VRDAQQATLRGGQFIRLFGSATPGALVNVWVSQAGALRSTLVLANASGAFSASVLPEPGTPLVAAVPADYAVSFPADARVMLTVYGLRLPASTEYRTVVGGSQLTVSLLLRNPGACESLLRARRRGEPNPRACRPRA
jgi:hypothetical protein